MLSFHAHSFPFLRVESLGPLSWFSLELFQFVPFRSVPRALQGRLRKGLTSGMKHALPPGFAFPLVPFRFGQGPIIGRCPSQDPVFSDSHGPSVSYVLYSFLKSFRAAH